MTNDEKRELLDWLKSWYAGIVPTDKIYDRPGEDAYNKLRALIEAPPPKHTQCENCLDDLEDYVWVYYDKCWQKLLADLKKARPMVSGEFLRQLAGELSTHNFSNQHPEVPYKILLRRFQAAGVEIKEEK